MEAPLRHAALLLVIALALFGHALPLLPVLLPFFLLALRLPFLATLLMRGLLLLLRRLLLLLSLVALLLALLLRRILRGGKGAGSQQQCRAKHRRHQKSLH